MYRLESLCHKILCSLVNFPRLDKFSEKK